MIALDLHADTRRIIDLLLRTPRGEVVTLAAISARIERDITQCRHLLYSALHHVERENGSVWALIRGKGYRRMEPDEIPKIGQTARARIRRTARRGIRSMEAGILGANDLSNETRRKILAEQSVLGLMEHLARERSLPSIGDDESKPLPIATTAKSFLQAIGVKL